MREDEAENDISQVLPLLLLKMSLKRFEVAIQISFFYSCLQLGLEQLIVTNIKVESTILSSLYWKFVEQHKVYWLTFLSLDFKTIGMVTNTTTLRVTLRYSICRTYLKRISQQPEAIICLFAVDKKRKCYKYVFKNQERKTWEYAVSME